MASFKKYFSYIFKSSYMRLLIMTVLSAILTFVSVSYRKYDMGYDLYDYNVSFNVLSVILGFLCFFVPVLELFLFKSRKGLDATMFLPVSRLKMSLAHYLNGLIQVLGIHTVCVIFAFFKLLPYANEIKIGYLFAYFGLATVFGIFVYSIFMFAFYQANTVGDGIVFGLLHMFALAIIAVALDTIFTASILNPVEYITVTPLGTFSNKFSTLCANDTVAVRNYEYAGTITTTVFGLLAIFGYFYTFTKKKTEDAENISNSIFGYKLMIPLYGYGLLFALGEVGEPIVLILLAIAMTCAYMIYRRTFKIKLKDIIFIVCSVIPWALGDLII